MKLLLVSLVVFAGMALSEPELIGQTAPTSARLNEIGATLHAMAPALTPAQIDAAIAYGVTHKRAHTQGLHLTDRLADASADKGKSSRGFSLTIFTPTTWVRERAAVAARADRVLTRADVNVVDALPLLRVIVYPDIPSYVDAGWQGISSVENVSIEDDAAQNAITTLAQEVFEMGLTNARTRAKISGFMGLRAYFTLEAVQSLRGNANAEYFVKIVGTTSEVKRFKIKRKHFDELP